MQYDGIACATDLIRTSLPALDNDLALQDWHFLQILFIFNVVKNGFLVATNH